MNWIIWLTVVVITFDQSLTQRRAIVSYPVTVSPPGAVSKPPIQPTATRPPSHPPVKGDASPEPRIAPDALRPIYQDSGYRGGSTANSSSSSRPTSDDGGEKGHRPYSENPRGEPKGRADGASRSSESILSGRDSNLPKGDFGGTGRTLSKPPTRPLPLTPPNRDASQGSKGSDTGVDRGGVRRVEDGDRTSTAQKDDRGVSRDISPREEIPVRPRLPLEREIRPKSEEKSNVDTRVRDADDYGANYPRTDPRPVRDDYDKGRSRDRDFREDGDSYEKGRSTEPRDYEDKGRASSDRDAYDERRGDRDDYGRTDERRGDRDDYGRTDERRSYPSLRDYDKGRPSSIDDPRPYDRNIPRSDRDRDSTDRDRDREPTPRRDSGRDRPRYDGDYDESDTYSKGRPPVSRDRDVYDDGRRVSDRGYSESDRRYDGEKSRRDSDYGVSRVADPRRDDRRDEERGRDYYDDDGYRRDRRPQGSRRDDDDDDEYYRRRARPPDSRRKGDEDGRFSGADRFRDRTDDRYRIKDYPRDSEDRYRSPSRSRRPEDEDRYRPQEDDDRYADRRDSDSRDDRYRDRDRRVEESRIRVEDRSSDRSLPDSDRDGYSVRSRPDRPIDDRDRSSPSLSDDRILRMDSKDEINARKRTDSRDDPPRDLPRSEISLRTVPERPKATLPDDSYRETSRGRERPASYDRGDDYRRDSDLPRSTVRDDKDRRDEPSAEDRYRDRSDRPYEERYRATSSRSDESLGSRARDDSRYVDDRRESSRAREPYDDKYYRDIESSRRRTDVYTDKGDSKSDDDYRRDQERTRSVSSSERDAILSTRYLATEKGDSEGSKSDDGYLRTRSYSTSDDDYDERDRRYSETSRSEAPRISSSRPRSRSDDYPSDYKDEERYRDRPSRYDREGYRKGDSDIRSDEERYRYRRKSISEDEYRNAQEEDYRRGITRSDPTSAHVRDSEVRRYDEKGSGYYMRNDEKFVDSSKGDQEERRRHYDERKDAPEDKGSLGISRDDSDGNGRRISPESTKGDRGYTPGSRSDESREPSYHSREDSKAESDSRYLETSRGRKGAESRYPSTSGHEAVKHVICDDEAESSKRDAIPPPPPPKPSTHLPPPLVTSSRGSSGYDCGGDHVHKDSTMDHVPRIRDTADHEERSTPRPRDIYPSRSSDNLPSSKPVRSITVDDQFLPNSDRQSSPNVHSRGNRQEQMIPEARTNNSHGSGNNDNKYEKGISIPSDERQEARNLPQTTMIPSDPSERPLTLKEVIEAAYRHPDSPEPQGAVHYPVYDPRINNITSPEVIRPSERRGITISTKKRRKW